MAYKEIRGLLVYRLNKSAYKALYGRGLRNRDGSLDSSYSKDYLQLSQDPEEYRKIAELLGVDESENIPVTYSWPGGTAVGSVVEKSADRPHLKWATNKAPQPWRLVLDPTQESVETIPGNPDFQLGEEASRQFDDILKSCGDIFLIAVALADEISTLHLRVCMTSPPVGLEWAKIDNLPSRICSIIESMPARTTSKIEIFTQGMNHNRSNLEELIDKLSSNPNQLLVGPPGTGKSMLLRQLAMFVEKPTLLDEVRFDPEKKAYNWATFEVDNDTPGKVMSLTLHPSFSYEDLVIGLRPEPSEHGTRIKATPGPLVNMAHFAATHDAVALLILDEFNRANTPAVFGDTLSLLDAGQRGTSVVRLPYSDLEAEIPSEFLGSNQRQIAGFLESFTLPPNLWIVGAMNTADRSIAPLDAAMRRRFTITEIMPDYSLLQQHLRNSAIGGLQQSMVQLADVAAALLQSLNDRISSVVGNDFQLGHSNFWGLRMDSEEAFWRSIAEAFDSNVAQSLKLELQGDDDSLAAILLADEVLSAGQGAKVAARWKEPPPSVGMKGLRRLEIMRLGDLTQEEIKREIERQMGGV
ncbi:AAA domain (dynein-related subfamily) [Corynebacterium coyleae]|uniref:AAA family ATPase n=1 Tax=Corynebacterium coyleae TaxID=53374 RepID=A0ABX8KWS4_9CORY|nr:AAA family ATPase [Corynebacterium coyleae]QXB17759.1 AAA family ATPase [Corynebacterium coyleae]WJY79165.1 5-methylcytosine-specific restriction enzyme B [Corynebacterium coyleae]SEB69482.1 AAA domain (dynein-related subfamily) [Corynebacterium coyleae]